MLRASLLIFIMLFANYVSASETSAPEKAFVKYIEAAIAYDVEQSVNLMHPEALDRLKKLMDGALTGPKSEQAKQELLPVFMVNDYKEFQSLTGKQLFKNMMLAALNIAPEMIEAMKKAKYKILSQTQEDGIAYISYRLTATMFGQEITEETVQKLKQHNGQWMLLLPNKSEEGFLNYQAAQ